MLDTSTDTDPQATSPTPSAQPDRAASQHCCEALFTPAEIDEALEELFSPFSTTR